MDADAFFQDRFDQLLDRFGEATAREALLAAFIEGAYACAELNGWKGELPDQLKLVGPEWGVPN